MAFRSPPLLTPQVTTSYTVHGVLLSPHVRSDKFTSRTKSSNRDYDLTSVAMSRSGNVCMSSGDVGRGKGTRPYSSVVRGSRTRGSGPVRPSFDVEGNSPNTVFVASGRTYSPFIHAPL